MTAAGPGSFHTVTALIIMFGRLADLFGRRPMYLTGTALMTASSRAAALAPDVTVLIVIRVMQAVGAAMLLANLAAMLALFPAERLPKMRASTCPRCRLRRSPGRRVLPAVERRQAALDAGHQPAAGAA